jgi:hypothetical protein
VTTADVKLLLQSYRAGGSDDAFPAVQAALRRLESDPELAAWFRAEQEFDAVMAQKFSEVPVNPGMKERIVRSLAETPEVSDPSER